MSILSTAMDGFGCYYGNVPGDSRQINVRREKVDGKPVAEMPTVEDDTQITGKRFGGWWVAYVAGEPIGCFSTKEFAEQQAVAWVKSHPEGVSRETGT